MPELREYGLPPLVGPNLVVLILGSFPSKMSLERNPYYGNPRNQFWCIMVAILSLKNTDAITVNSELLKLHHIAVMDVIRSRQFQWGSSDRDISDPDLNDDRGIYRSVPDAPVCWSERGEGCGMFQEAGLLYKPA